MTVNFFLETTQGSRQWSEMSKVWKKENINVDFYIQKIYSYKVKEKLRLSQETNKKCWQNSYLADTSWKMYSYKFFRKKANNMSSILIYIKNENAERNSEIAN